MKYLCFVLFLCFFHTDHISAHQSSFLNFDLKEVSITKSNYSFWYSPKNVKLHVDLNKEKLFNLKYDNIVDVVAVILLCITTFLVVICPLILVYLWIFYSYAYVKKYRQIFSVKKWIFSKTNLKSMHLEASFQQNYRKTYALMLGFGLAICAYLISSIRFMSINFDKMETAMVEYFRFPFLVLDQFGLIKNSMETEISFDFFWNQMLLIVVISGLFFLIGYLIGNVVVDLRLKYLNKEVQKSNAQKKSKTIYLKTKKNQPFKVRSKTVDFF